MAQNASHNEIAHINFNDTSSMRSMIASNKQLESKLRETVQEHTIDVDSAMKSLTSVGQVLKLAYAGSKGFPCSVPVLKILSNYQSMIKNSFIATTAFVDGSLSALNYHKMALTLAEKNKLQSALQIIDNCAKLANQMAAESNKLVEEAKALTNLSEEALLTSKKNELELLEKNKQIASLKDQSHEKQTNLKVQSEMLDQEIIDAKLEEAKIIEKFEKETNRNFGLKVATTVLSSVNQIVKSVSNTIFSVPKIKLPFFSNQKGNENDSSLTESIEKNDKHKEKEPSYLEKLGEKEIEIIKKKKELQREQRLINGEIAEIGERLKNLIISEEDLTASIVSLELVVKALGKIKTTFENTRQFWNGIETECKKLANNEMLKLTADEDMKEDFIEQIKLSGFKWLTLGRINYSAKQAIQETDKNVDDILCNLPNKNEALSIIQNDFENIINSIKYEQI